MHVTFPYPFLILVPSTKIKQQDYWLTYNNKQTSQFLISLHCWINTSDERDALQIPHNTHRFLLPQTLKCWHYTNMHRDYHYEAEVSILLADPTSFTHSITILHMVAESGSNSHSEHPHSNREMHLQTLQHALPQCIIVIFHASFPLSQY